MEETLVTSMSDPANGSLPLSSTLLGQEEIQQELVVTAIKVKKRSRRQQGKQTGLTGPGLSRKWTKRWSSLTDSSGSSRVSDSSVSDSTSGVQCGGGSAAEQILLVSLERPKQGCGEDDPDPESGELRCGQEADSQ